VLRNYLTIALRNLIRHKLYSVINIAGLAVGLTCALFIILFVRDELSYDKWVPDSANLYRVEQTIYPPGRPPLALAVISFPMPAAMRDEIPEVTGMTRLWSEPMTLTVGERQFPETVDVVDPDFFQVIKLPLIAGNPAEVFRQPESVVLSEAAARRYFGNANPIGRTITDAKGQCADGDTQCRNSTVPLTVTGIVRDLPHNSQLKGDVFLPNTSIADYNDVTQKQSWLSQNGWGYVTLAPGTDPRVVIAKMAPVLDRALGPALRQIHLNVPGSRAYELHLTPFAQVHLSSERWTFNLTPPGSYTTLYGIVAIGFLILLVACFNFMNLATARAMMRAREIALRKTLGAARRQLIVQFLGESMLMALLGLVLALALAEVLLPVLGRFLQRPLDFHYLTAWPVLLLILAVALAAGLVSGTYPALVLSGFRPATVLRNNSSGHAGSGRLRATLVVLQFSVSIGLGIAAAVVFGQIRFARAMELGFHRDNVLIVGHAGRVFADGQTSFVQALRSNPGILDMALSDMAPFDMGQSLDGIRLPGQPDLILLNRIVISPDFPRFYGMRLLAGRELSTNRSQDRMNTMKNSAEGDPANTGHNLLINETAAARLGFTPQQAAGQSIIYNNYPATIVGVLADAKLQGAREPVKATAYVYDPQRPAQLSLRLRPDTIPQTLAFVDKSWHAFAPIAAVNRHFLDDSFEALYREDERQGEIFGILVGIAICIASLGLFGLAAFTAGRRTKEIGLRKVVGARTRDVMLLLLWQFSIPVLIANLIAWPLAWYYLHGWLQGFAYRIPLGAGYFLGAGAVALVIAWITVATHAVRVARARPIAALRYE
jgi:putative ABC transport system permease protein